MLCKFFKRLRRRSNASDSSALDSERATTSVKDGKRNGHFFKLKRKMLKADVSMGESYSNTDELAGVTRKISHSDILGNADGTDGKDPLLVRKISRTADGKFRLSELEIESANNRSATNSPRKKFTTQSRSHSAEWDTREPLLHHQHVDDSLEIDCSHSDIEVRFIKDGLGKAAFHTLSSRSGPKQYNLLRRQIGPCDKSFDSSIAESSFPSPRDPHTRQYGVSSANSGQYVNTRSSSASRGSVHPEYRVSLPPHLSGYNMVPNSPHRYGYLKRPERIHSPYRGTSRDSFPSPVQGLVYDPRYTRIEPLVAVDPYKRHQAPNRHSAFVIDSRREFPNHPHPHRAIQIFSLPKEHRETPNYPTPKWRDGTEPQYHTISGVRRSKKDGRSVSSNHGGGDNKKPSRCLSETSSGVNKGVTFTTNSLGRPRKKKEEGTKRRRVQSMSNLTLAALALEEKLSAARATGSEDFLSLKREEPAGVYKNENQHNLAGLDRTTHRHGADESSDITNVSTSSRASNNAIAGRQNNSKGNDKKSDKDVLTSPRNDDSSGVSSALAHPLHSQTGMACRGYDCHNTNHTSADSPALSLSLCSPPNEALRPSPHDHDRTSTASSSDRSRKDTSSVDEKYEWDSEFAMESEIVEALRHFGNHSRSGSVSQALVDEIRKLGVDRVQAMNKDQLATLEKAVTSRRYTSSDEGSDRLTIADSTVSNTMYSKESMEKRCAALKKEYQRYQMEQIQASYPITKEKLISSRSANA